MGITSSSSQMSNLQIYSDKIQSVFEVQGQPISILLVDIEQEKLNLNHSQIYLQYENSYFLFSYNSDGFLFRILEKNEINFRNFSSWINFEVKERPNFQQLRDEIKKFLIKQYNEKSHNCYNFAHLILKALTKNYNSQAMNSLNDKIEKQFLKITVAPRTITSAVIWGYKTRTINLGLAAICQIQQKQLNLL